ncbi:MobF family relaxase [Acidisoma sp. S159]|uniref:MobF family relaxase n=1 Tax=Acidisoma sp. S159 TaxID=1747225 RepID=UPI0020B13515|nr:MobF family relaxase [Acidisoma sp. S159]
MTFRKLAAESAGKLIRAYFTENTPQPAHDFRTDPGRVLDGGGRLTSYYTSRDSRATWRPDMPSEVAKALGIDPRTMPKDADLDQLFEAKRADTAEAWTDQKRKVSAYDLTLAPHKSVTLAAEFAATAAESAMIWHAIDRANDATMRFVAREVGWARKGKAGEDGADPGEVGWVSFRHHTARPTLPVQDGAHGATYLAQSPIGGDPHAHIHNALFNLVVTEDSRVGSLDTQRLHSRVHEFGAFFQARLADELRRLGARIGYDKNQQAVVLEAIPQQAVDLFSKGRRQVLGSAKAYAQSQGLDWDALSIEGKFKILSTAGLASRLKKHGDKNDHEIWREQAATIGWRHQTILNEIQHKARPAAERFDAAYRFAARHLAQEFHTAAVIDHDKLRIYAARGLIGTGIAGGVADIDQVVSLIEQRGLTLKGEHVALILGMSGDKVRVTNTAQVRIEESLAAEAARAAAGKIGALSHAAIATAIATSGLDFTSQPDHGAAQKAAIYALGQGGALSLLTGVAGAGKTTLLKPLVEAWKADTRCDVGGREVVGLATGWKQADALKDAGIDRRLAMDPLLKAIESGEFAASRNTVLVIDEISQVAPRAMLALLQLQRTTGLTIKALGDREQAQSVEAGDAIEILRRVLPKEAQAELLSTVRQKGRNASETRRLRMIAGLFRGTEPDLDSLDLLARKRRGRRISGPRHANAQASLEAEERRNHHLGEVEKALAMKRQNGTARFIGGDQDQVISRIADFYMQRRDALTAAGAKGGITVSAPTNADTADLSRAIRDRMKLRGELRSDEQVYDAIDQRGEHYAIPIATGDKLRLFRRTWAKIEGKGGSIGNNGDIVEVVGRMANGLMLRDKDGRVGEVEWKRLEHKATGRLLVGFGHAMTIDAAQGITSDEHINALPRGTAGMTGFTAYVAESRARGTTWTMISDEATFDAVRNRRALGDLTPIKAEDMWSKVAEDMAAKPYKALGMDLMQAAREDRELAVRSFMAAGHRVETMELQGRNLGREARDRMQAEAVRKSIPALIASLDGAIAAAETTLTGPLPDREAHLRSLRIDAELSRRGMDHVAARRSSSPSPGM